MTVNLSKTPGSLPIYFIWTATERKGFLADLDSSALRNTKTQRCNLTLSFGIVSEVKQRTNSGICKPVGREEVTKMTDGDSKKILNRGMAPQYLSGSKVQLIVEAETGMHNQV